MRSYFHIKDAEACSSLPVAHNLFGSLLIGFLRASISRDPFYDMLATRKRRIANKKWERSWAASGRAHAHTPPTLDAPCPGHPPPWTIPTLDAPCLEHLQHLDTPNLDAPCPRHPLASSHCTWALATSLSWDTKTVSHKILWPQIPSPPFYLSSPYSCGSPLCKGWQNAAADVLFALAWMSVCIRGPCTWEPGGHAQRCSDDPQQLKEQLSKMLTQLVAKWNLVGVRQHHGNKIFLLNAQLISFITRSC